ncbi:MAG: NAD(P)-dependent oxidoreductase [Arcanobacterium sp.]|nr:NAD(P)-dependent oxidoreductase [Arcanobacterium sp.]
MNITILGIGAMGLPMATNLAANGFNVTAFDVSEERCKLGATQGLNIATNPREAAKGADVLLLAVRNAQQLNEALFGADGVAEDLADGAEVILTSTVGLEAVAEVGQRLAELGLGLIDAPISGGPVRAGNGDLLVVVGATEENYQKALPVLEAMSSTLVKVGNQPGKGQAMKTVNQLLCGVHIAAAGEALALAGRLGLDKKQALDALMAGAAASFMLGDRGQRMLETDVEAVEVKSRLDIFVKDMGIVTDAAKSVGLATPVAAAAEQLYVLGNNAGMGAMDDSSVTYVVDGMPK